MTHRLDSLIQGKKGHMQEEIQGFTEVPFLRDLHAVIIGSHSGKADKQLEALIWKGLISPNTHPSSVAGMFLGVSQRFISVLGRER